MTWTGAIAALHADLLLAAGDVSPAVPLVRYGEPDALAQDTIWYAPTGHQPSRTSGNTLALVFVELGVSVTALLRGSTRAGVLDAALEERLIALDQALITRIWADYLLDGNAIGLAFDEASYDWVEIGGQLARSLTFTVWIDLPSAATIVP